MNMLKRGLALLLALLMIGGAMNTCFAEGIARRPIPDNEAMAFLQSLGVGWNLGNTFDAFKNGWNQNADEMTVETSWGVPLTQEAVFDALKAAGFSTVRIPVSWHDHVSGEDHVISERWLARVQQVVDWALARDLYVILNIHHDEDQFLPTSAHYEESAHYISCIWQQLAERFRDYDEHLIFNSMNEPRVIGSAHEWFIDHADPDCRQPDGGRGNVLAEDPGSAGTDQTGGMTDGFKQRVPGLYPGTALRAGRDHLQTDDGGIYPLYQRTDLRRHL